MKALVIASLLFFSLRAMSAEELGENQKSDCPAANQSGREAKVIDTVGTEIQVEDTKGISK